jgi:hypothetical protein
MRAGDRDRTGMASLEGWGSTIELHPRCAIEQARATSFHVLAALRQWPRSPHVEGPTSRSQHVKPPE